MRRYELMLVLRPDLADDRVQATLDRATRSITTSGGQIVKVGPWGRRRLAYPIGQYREGSYFIVIFDAPSEAIVELERGLNITEEAMRHLVTRIERPLGTRRSAAGGGDEEDIDHEMIGGGRAEGSPGFGERADHVAHALQQRRERLSVFALGSEQQDGARGQAGTTSVVAGLTDGGSLAGAPWYYPRLPFSSDDRRRPRAC